MSALILSALLVTPAAIAQGQPTASKTVTCSETRHFHGIAYVPSTRRLVVTDTENNVIYHYDMMDATDGSSVTAAVTWSHLGSGNYQGIEYHEGTDRFFLLLEGTVRVLDSSGTEVDSFNASSSSESDLTIKDDTLYVVSNDYSVNAFDVTSPYTQTNSWTAPQVGSSCCPSIAYDPVNDVMWHSEWNSGTPTNWVATDPSTGAVQNTYSPISGSWGHGMDFAECYILLGTETATPDQVRFLRVPCDPDGDGLDGDVDNCPRDSNAGQADLDGDGDGDACDDDADGDGDPAATDCDDANAAVNSSATEVCDGLDNNCDGSTDDASATDASTWYTDADGDGFGDMATASTACNQPSGAVADATDCDDTAATAYPGANELCDGVDNDCDGTVDEDDAVDAGTWYVDADGDGHGDATTASTSCTQPSGTVASGDDCDDTNGQVSPSAQESCDTIDNDCDGTVDEPDAVDASTWYNDADGDGYGNPALAETACNQPATGVANADDCDDGTSLASPAATEVCDTIDNDCDGTIDEDDAAFAPTWYEDADGDGYGTPNVTTTACTQPTGYTTNDDDCNDTTSAAHEGAPEVCDAIDNDCDGNIDEDDATDALTWYLDADGDGHGTTNLTTVACNQPSGYVASSDDCNDLNASALPGGTEVCDGADNDCDGTVDEDDATDAGTWYADADGDGFGDAGTSVVACEAPSGHIEDAGDCDDAEATTNPDAVDTWYDGVDSDCDGASDFDADADGHDSDAYGGGDCDDEDDEIHPDAVDAWYDGIDTNCDGLSDFDADGDGFDSASYEGDDCDDANADTYPGAPDTPHDGVINDCNNTSDNDADGDGFDSAEYGGDDCDDANSAIHPEAEETWYDGVDDNCDGNDDDQDTDGFGVDDDCDDTDSTAYPGAPGWSEDCEVIEEDTATDTDMGDTGAGGETLKGGSRCSSVGSTGSGGAGWFGVLGLLLAFVRRGERWAPSS